MKIRAGQLICLILGVLFVSLGGGMLGGRLIAGKSGAVAVQRPSSPMESVDTTTIKDSPPSPLRAEPELQPESEDTSATAGEVAPVAPSVDEPVAALKDTVVAAEEPSAESEINYVIQAISTSIRTDAHAARKRIMVKGFPAGIFEADLPGKGRWYRVYVGPYETEAEARRALEAVRDIPGFSESFLKKLD
jgi:cell division protein FtsN